MVHLVKVWHDTTSARPSVTELDNSFKARRRTNKNKRNKHPYQRNQKLVAEIDRRARLQVGEGVPLTLRLLLTVAEAMDSEAEAKFPDLSRQARFTRVRAQYDVAEKAGKESVVGE